MTSYTSIINDFVDEFTTDPEQVRLVVSDTAERFRDDYHNIVDVPEEEFDKEVLNDFFKEVRTEIVEALKVNELL